MSWCLADASPGKLSEMQNLKLQSRPLESESAFCPDSLCDFICMLKFEKCALSCLQYPKLSDDSVEILQGPWKEKRESPKEIRTRRHLR